MPAWQNYLGQLRLYSLLDLVLLLIAARADWRELSGCLLLWLGFLALLETRHRHYYRLPLPRFLWSGLWLGGLFLYERWEGLIAIALFIIYTLKTKRLFGFLSPLVRGGQNYVLVVGLTGYTSPLAYLAFVLTTLRNFFGDWRDADKDRQEGVTTIPVALGLSSLPNGHLLITMLTSIIWWQQTDLPISYLFFVIIGQFVTYNLTPR